MRAWVGEGVKSRRCMHGMVQEKNAPRHACISTGIPRLGQHSGRSRVMHACVEGVNSRWCMHDTVQEKHARILRHACISAGIPRLARPEMGNASGRAEDLADADMDDGNNVRRASSSSAGYVRGGGSSSSPPVSPPRPHSPRMFVPQVRSLLIMSRLLGFELLA